MASTKGGYRGASDPRSTYKADSSQSKFGDDRGAASTKGSDSRAAASFGGDRNSAYSEYKKSELLNRYNKKKFDTSERASSSDDDNRAYGEKRTGSTTAFGNDRFAASTFGSDSRGSAVGDREVAEGGDFIYIESFFSISECLFFIEKIKRKKYIYWISVT